MKQRKPTRIADLKVGDKTPWYEVVSDPEPNGDEIMVGVRHFDTGEISMVRGQADEEVPLV